MQIRAVFIVKLMESFFTCFNFEGTVTHKTFQL